jgi:site-specific recombinase XerD
MASINLNSSPSIEEAFESFLFSKSAQGVTDKTLKSYKSHFQCISKRLDTSIKLNNLKKETIYKMIAEMRHTDLSPNTIASYS